MTENKTQEKEEWKVAAEQDDELLSADDLITQVIPVKGKPTLSHVGYASIANRKGGISVEELNYKETEEGIFVSGHGKNKEGDIRYACHMQPRSTKANEDPAFDWAKAFSKFQRNLFKMFIYGDPLVDETIAKWKEKEANKKSNTHQQTTNNKQQPTNTTQQPQSNKQLKDAQDAARKAYQAPETLAICKEIGVELGSVFTEAKNIWGDNTKWTINLWKSYHTEIQNFQKKEGKLYNRLNPPTDTPNPNQ